MVGIDLKNRWNIVLILAVITAACIGGIMTGNKIADVRAAVGKQQQIDETLGLAQRTGITSELTLQVNPVRITAKSGDPMKISLTLGNTSKKPILLNGWLTPAPAFYESNQLPFKQAVTISGREIGYRGNIILYPPHKKSEFIRLDPGKTYTVNVDVTRGPDDGRWNISTPGTYTIELWYETYLTGKYSGVRAWTGMTNHIVVKATALPRK